MSKTEPTKGPWIAGPYGDVWVGIHRNADGKWDEDSPGSAVVVTSPSNPADRPLIAAAWSMREALKAICAEFATNHPLIVAGRAALALAAPTDGDAP